MPHTTGSSGRVSGLLRITWDDLERSGEVVVVLEGGGLREVAFARSCDAWCFPLHARKGAERLLQQLAFSDSPQWAGELFDDA